MSESSERQRFEDAGVMRIEDFKQLRKGQLVTLFYNDTNSGSFVWVHDRVEGDRVYGRAVYAEETIDEVPVDNTLYAWRGYVCRGSGAEPVCRELPADDPLDRGGGLW